MNDRNNIFTPEIFACSMAKADFHKVPDNNEINI